MGLLPLSAIDHEDVRCSALFAGGVIHRQERTVTENSTQIILIDPNRRQSSLRYFAALRQHTVGEREANTGTRNKVGKVGTWGAGQ